MILYWLDKLKFSPSLVEYLIEQCVAKNHMSIRYMDKIALSWAESGIRTLTDAKQALQTHDHAVYAVQKAFGISNRTLAQAELKFVHKWSKELHFSDEIIALACEKTILRIHQISFDYADSILQNWKQHNVRTVNDVKLLDAQYQEAKAKKSPQAKRQYAQQKEPRREVLPIFHSVLTTTKSWNVNYSRRSANVSAKLYRYGEL